MRKEGILRIMKKNNKKIKNKNLEKIIKNKEWMNEYLNEIELKNR